VITDAGRKAPLELIHQAERAGGIWRGQSARGALWCACLTSESGETFSIILENRFDANAFKDLRVVPQRGRVRLLFHLRSLGRSLKTSEEQAQRAEDLARDKVAIASQSINDEKHQLDSHFQQAKFFIAQEAQPNHPPLNQNWSRPWRFVNVFVSMKLNGMSKLYMNKSKIGRLSTAGTSACFTD